MCLLHDVIQKVSASSPTKIHRVKRRKIREQRESAKTKRPRLRPLTRSLAQRMKAKSWLRAKANLTQMMSC
jgi:hypothetical protein